VVTVNWSGVLSVRESRPLDASEFAVHLDQVRDGRVPEDYRKPERFFERTYMTRGLAFWRRWLIPVTT
jgi:predicted AAA+ superfamily ATPase